MNKNCKRPLEVKNHSHYAGKSRSYAPLRCNLRFKKKHYVLVITHNSSGYHVIIHIMISRIYIL